MKGRAAARWSRLNSAFRIPHSAFLFIPHSEFRIWFSSPHPEQLKPPLVPLHDALPISGVLRLHERRVARDDLAGGAARGLEQREICLEVGVTQRDAPGLARARELAHAALLEVEFRDLEAVAGLGEGLQPRGRLGGVGDEDAM